MTIFILFSSLLLAHIAWACWCGLAVQSISLEREEGSKGGDKKVILSYIASLRLVWEVLCVCMYVCE